MFGKTAKQWREQNPDVKGNIRDYATIEQLLVLANIESFNAELIRQNIPQGEQLKVLNDMAISQLKSLLASNVAKKLTVKGNIPLIEYKEDKN